MGTLAGCQVSVVRLNNENISYFLEFGRRLSVHVSCRLGLTQTLP